MMDLDTIHPDSRQPHRSCLGPQSHGLKQGSINRSLVSQIEALIPRLRRYARAMVRDPVAADDLVQDSLAQALAKIHLWEDGTDLRAWLFTILHNRHISLERQAARHRRVIELQKFKPARSSCPIRSRGLSFATWSGPSPDCAK